MPCDLCAEVYFIHLTLCVPGLFVPSVRPPCPGYSPATIVDAQDMEQERFARVLEQVRNGDALQCASLAHCLVEDEQLWELVEAVKHAGAGQFW